MAKFYKILFLFLAGIIILGGFLVLGSANNASAAVYGYCCCNNGTQYYQADPADPCGTGCDSSGGTQWTTTYDSTENKTFSCQEATPTADSPSGPYDYDNCMATCPSSNDPSDCEAGCQMNYGSSGSGTIDTEVSPGTNSGLNDALPGTNSGLNKSFFSGGQGKASLPNFLGVTDIKQLFLKIVDFLTLLAMPFAVLMLIWSGFLFVTAQGSDEKLKTARKNLVWTIAGIAVIVAAKLIVNYIMEALGVSSVGTGTAMLDKVKGAIKQVIGFLFILVTVYFLWGVTEFVRASGSGGKGVEEGKKHMVWGVIGMAVMLGAWTIVTMLQDFFK